MKEYTKDLLCDALKDLMKKKTIQDIRVAELCRICEIERSTFYYHFKDKYELITYIYFKDFDGLDVRDYRQAAEGMEKMRKHICFYQNAYKDFPENFFLNYLQDYYYDVYYAIIKKNMYPKDVPEDIKFKLRLFLAGSCVMSMKWIFSSKPMPATKLMEMAYDGMPEAVKRVLY